ncbi:MAG TPA: NAD-dependent epimerase/dehydratase family protein [Planctomycetota bacterium]|nr:NAD-dependent epimerase/dehydratase family protein [Planctomycetota bacterium]
MLDERPPSRIAITGIAGYLGRELAGAFDVDETTEHVLGIDVAPYVAPSPKIAFVQKTVEEPFADLFVEHNIDAAVHLAFCLDPLHDRAKEERINIEGTKNFLDACSKAKVKTVLVASSATAYGALEDNPMILYEGAPLRAAPSFPYAHDKARVEELCYEFARTNPEACLIIVRPCVIIGPHVSNFISRSLEKPIVFAARGYDPPIQLVHEDDAVRAIFRLLKLRKMGVFNIAADGALTLSRVAHMAGRRLFHLPLFLLRWIVALGWRFGWKRITEAPPGFLDFVVHPWLISNVKLKTELLFLFKYDALRAMQDFIDARDAQQGGPKRADLILDVEDEDLDELEAADSSLEESAAPPPPPSPAVGENDETPRTGAPRPPEFGSEPAPPPEPAKPVVSDGPAEARVEAPPAPAAESKPATS